MKFVPIISAGLGLSLTLRNGEGEAVGLISSCFVSSNRGAFCTNLQSGYLTANASVFDMKSGVNVKVDEWVDSTCKVRADADRAFRKWIKDACMREKLITAAVEFAQR